MPIRTLSLSLLLACIGIGGVSLSAADGDASSSATAPDAAPAPAPTTGSATPAHAPPPPLPGDPRYNRPRFIAVPQDGKLYVFHAGAKELKVFAKTHTLENGYERIGVGPDGMTVVAPNADTLDGYLALYFGSATAAAAAARDNPSASVEKPSTGASKSP